MEDGGIVQPRPCGMARLRRRTRRTRRLTSLFPSDGAHLRGIMDMFQAAVRAVVAASRPRALVASPRMLRQHTTPVGAVLLQESQRPSPPRRNLPQAVQTSPSVQRGGEVTLLRRRLLLRVASRPSHLAVPLAASLPSHLAVLPTGPRMPVDGMDDCVLLLMAGRLRHRVVGIVPTNSTDTDY